MTPSRMVYYLTLHSCACIGIVGMPRMTRRSASTKEHLHHPRGKPGREDGRRSCKVYTDQMTRSRRTSDPLQTPDDRRTPDIRQVPGTGRPTLTGNPVPPIPKQNDGRPTPSGRPDPHERPNVRRRSDVRPCLCAAGPLALYLSPTYPFVA